MMVRYIIIIVVLVSASFLASYLLLNWHATREREKISAILLKDKTENEEKARKEYFDLIERQARETNATKSSVFENILQRKALGPQTLNIVYIKPSTLSDNEIFPLIERLNRQENAPFTDCHNGKCTINASLNFVATYFLNEAAKYDVKDFSLKINIFGPYVLADLGKVGDIAYIWGKDPFGIAKLKDSFENVLKQNGLNFSKDDMVLFLYFDDTLNDNDINKEVSFYEMKKFRSFADDEKSRIYVNVYEFSPLFAGIVDKIVVHETMHLFGATDKYIESPEDRLCLEGTGGDIMCLFVEDAKGKYRRGEVYDGTLLVGPISAREIGWVN